jgi:hypothetical protein
MNRERRPPTAPLAVGGLYTKSSLYPLSVSLHISRRLLCGGLALSKLAILG